VISKPRRFLDDIDAIPGKEEGEFMKDMLHRLENTVLELGAELYSLKHDLREATQRNAQLVAGFQALQNLLDQHGIIDEDEFSLAVGMLELVDDRVRLEGEYTQFIDNSKKTSH